VIHLKEPLPWQIMAAFQPKAKEILSNHEEHEEIIHDSLSTDCDQRHGTS
jgi:hypothetical protein